MKKGFTLIELLIVIAIIGVLSALITVGYNSAKVNSRDAKRISDISALDSAARLMYEDTKKILVSACGNITFTVFDEALNSTLVPEYINIIPHDPENIGLKELGLNAQEYLYISTNSAYMPQNTTFESTCSDVVGLEACSTPCFEGSSHYFFYANLENSKNSYININEVYKAKDILDNLKVISTINRYVVSGP